MRSSAPGRLDLLGGVADYSGALVLEMATRQRTEVVVTPDERLRVGPVVLSADELAALAHRTYVEIRAELAPFPRWTHYVIGVAVMLIRRGVIEPPRGRLEIVSDLPASVGVASSAALEVATARALGAGTLPPLHLAALCQEAENYVVGAPCGIMDQVAAAMGEPGTVLPILCRPASASAPVPLPPGLEIVGWPTGTSHDVGASALRARPDGCLHGKAAGRGCSGAPMVLGERTSPPGRRCVARPARRGDVPEEMGRNG